MVDRSNDMLLDEGVGQRRVSAIANLAFSGLPSVSQKLCLGGTFILPLQLGAVDTVASKEQRTTKQVSFGFSKEGLRFNSAMSAPGKRQ